ncbi:serologically defined colon cancer antigen 8 homolog isoform X2 [Biomphalaria glabrata]|uniref:Serologically defined colon cancer antigen 8 homolog isoform X2 n=1 Tax=Biomphalaria glabrata TaxID=6526 RepID=A0A9U8DUB1_BIOGL|nr:serologically defined colon cancer antigen 8 homolog isoform X2 [Biomphalaria glabrata]
MYYFKDYGAGSERGDFDYSTKEESKENYHDHSQTGRIGDGKQNLTKAVHPRILTWEDRSQRSLRQTNAAAQLRNTLLSMQESSDVPLGPLPSPEEAAVLLRNHAAYTSHLESESAYIKEEIAVIRMKLAEVLEENRTLHNELKTTVVHDILKDGGEIINVMGTLDQTFSDSYSNVMGRHDFKRWQVELERLSKLHAAKTERLESQLGFSKSEVEKLQQTVEDLKSQLRIQDSIPTHENGSLIEGAFLSEAQRHITYRTIEKLTKERDELMDHVTALQSQLKEMSQREEDAYQQMKKGIQLVEQAQLEQTEALVEKEQVCEELLRVRQRFEAHVRESQTVIRAERETVRRENQALIDDLNNKLKELAEFYTLVQSKYEKEVRDKAALAGEIAELKSQLRTCDREVTVTAESYRTETTNASLQRNSALYESNRLRSELEKVRHEHEQETSRTKIELDDLRQRLNKAERELINSKEECIHMTSTIQALERELHLAKMARDTIERSRLEDLKVIRKQAQDREEEMILKMEEADDRHSQATHEMDTMLLKQNKLILKLREECKKQAIHLEKTIKKYRGQNGKLQQANSELMKRMERMSLRVTELENQSDQHVRVHDKMKDRLKSLDEQAQHQAVQLVEAITKYSQLSRDRQLLAREVEFLRSQLHKASQTSTEVLRLNSSSKVLVDDILNTMTKDERDGTIALIPELQLNIPDLPAKIDLEDTFSETGM